MMDVTIQAASRFRVLDLAEVWRYRELLYFLVWRDVKLRFKQTALGVAWIVVRPLLSVAIFVVIFGHLAKMPSDGVPYATFTMIAMVPWMYFASAVAGASQSLVSNSSLITKVYVPRLVLPLAAVLSNLVEVAITLALTLGIVFRDGVVPSPQALWAVPALLLLTSAFALGCGLWLGALNVRFRDVGNAVPFLLQVWMYATPVVYPVSLVPREWRWMVALNPLAGIIDGLRGVLLARPVEGLLIAEAVAIVLVVLVTGMYFFRSVERSFADTV
jgi:lipopolysaccharide transport system permease protein